MTELKDLLTESEVIYLMFTGWRVVMGADTGHSPTHSGYCTPAMSPSTQHPLYQLSAALPPAHSLATHHCPGESQGQASTQHSCCNAQHDKLLIIWKVGKHYYPPTLILTRAYKPLFTSLLLRKQNQRYRNKARI